MNESYYLYHARRLFIPWTLLASTLLAFGLISLAGNWNTPRIALAAAQEEFIQAASDPAETNPDATSPANEEPGSLPSENNGCQVSQEFPEGVLQWCELITHYAFKNQLKPDLVAALIWQESGGQADAYSHSGAAGLMQVMPRDGIAASFNCANGPCFSDRPTTAELMDPEFNIQFGTGMLAQLVQKSGSVREALHAYGPMDMGYAYADKVLSLFQQYGR